jgi:hypothetical protein
MQKLLFKDRKVLISYMHDINYHDCNAFFFLLCTHVHPHVKRADLLLASYYDNLIYKSS